MGIEEETQSRCKRIDVESGRKSEFDICKTVCERKCEFLDRSRARLTDVVSRNRHRVPSGHFARCEINGVTNEPHRLARWEHEFFLSLVLLQDVVLQRSAKSGAVYPSLFGLSDEHRKDDGSRGVDRHRGRDLA